MRAGAGAGDGGGNVAEPTQIFTSPHVLEYPYSRSTGPVIGSFLTALRDGVLIGIRGTGGTVIVPPTEYDPSTSEETSGIVEVGPGGVVTSWAWVAEPLPQHPLQHPFAWALVQLDGADTAILHALDAGSEEAVSTGMRVTASWKPAEERIGNIFDLRAFVPEEAK
jgi:uncharacterized protein